MRIVFILSFLAFMGVGALGSADEDENHADDVVVDGNGNRHYRLNEYTVTGGGSYVFYGNGDTIQSVKGPDGQVQNVFTGKDGTMFFSTHGDFGDQATRGWNQAKKTNQEAFVPRNTDVARAITAQTNEQIVKPAGAIASQASAAATEGVDQARKMLDRLTMILPGGAKKPGEKPDAKKRPDRQVEESSPPEAKPEPKPEPKPKQDFSEAIEKDKKPVEVPVVFLKRAGKPMPEGPYHTLGENNIILSHKEVGLYIPKKQGYEVFDRVDGTEDRFWYEEPGKPREEWQIRKDRDTWIFEPYAS